VKITKHEDCSGFEIIYGQEFHRAFRNHCIGAIYSPALKTFPQIATTTQGTQVAKVLPISKEYHEMFAFYSLALITTQPGTALEMPLFLSSPSHSASGLTPSTFTAILITCDPGMKEGIYFLEALGWFVATCCTIVSQLIGALAMHARDDDTSEIKFRPI
jgi:hypothetical protein